MPADLSGMADPTHTGEEVPDMKKEYKAPELVKVSIRRAVLTP